ncbi:MAG: endonuclease III [Actinomycetaceae bacterium]|nr:endonuclease III [Arcanobacterium sp.]MDD7687605.1 endonuclease III [Actinomycetaceae bacterium]MDY5273157.1 endonuclease III [Arcanobacterium sp.]
MARKKIPARPRSLKARREAVARITDRLACVYPDSHASLDFRSPFELLVATVLSAQTTDVRVNSVTPELFAAYPTPQALAEAPRDELERILRPVGFFRAKARSLHLLAQGLLERFDGEVPRTLEQLTTLHGVGRKTANVVLGDAFHTPGITVDTHVGRISRRWGWTREHDPVKAEAELARLLPPEIWTVTCHRIIDHGRAICTARNPKCLACPLADLCPSYEIEVGHPWAAHE